MFISLSTLLHALALALALTATSIPFVAAQAPAEITTEQLYGTLSSTAAPAPGFNAEGGSVFTNFVNAVNDGQFFLLNLSTGVAETPGSEPLHGAGLTWCADLTFSDLSNSSLMGYAGRCVAMKLAKKLGKGKEADIIALIEAGDKLPFAYSPGDFVKTRSISAVYVEQLNIFQGQLHSNTDNYVYRYWDSGLNRVPWIRWEGHDEGDMASNAATSSRSNFGEITWMSVEEVTQLFNTTVAVDEFTPETFNQVYEDAWTTSTGKKQPRRILIPGLSWRLLRK